VSPRRKLSTSARVALAVSASLALGVFALSSMAYFRVADRLQADLDRSLQREAEAFSAALRRPEQQGTGDLVGTTRAYLEARSASASTLRPILLVRFASGRVISNSEVTLEHSAVDSTALSPAGAKRALFDVSYRGLAYRAATVPITDTRGQVVAVFEAALPTAGNSDLLAELLATLAGVGALIIVIGAALSVWAARASLAPLRHAARTTERVTQSSLGQRVAYDGPDDEVGALVHSVNGMLGRLEGAFGEQRRFVADASHELRTPLQVVSGHLEILEHDTLTPQERDEELELLSQEVARMGRLVDDLLALARLESGTPRPRQPLDVSTLLEEAAVRGRALADRDLRVDAAPGLWVSGDPDQLLQALLNLVSNAVDHTSTGGRIVLRSSANARTVTIAVLDDGNGIRPEDLSRIFDRFYRAHGPRGERSGGSGLGLAITKRLVELHDGTMAAANRPEGGAVFSIALPRIAAPAH
jgi:two-component system, OmpR family, sensor kinase